MRLDLIPQQSGCESCELHQQGSGMPRNVGLPTRQLEGSLPLTPQTDCILYVGQNPGVQEDEKGLCFVGPSGDMLRDVYVKGIKANERASLFLTNAVRCHTIGNAPPAQKSFRTCMDLYFLEDLDRLVGHAKRVAIVTLGAHATKHVYRVFGLKVASLKSAFSQQGTQVAHGLHRVSIYSTYHPAAVIREHNLINIVAAHNSQISHWLDGNEVRPSKPEIVEADYPGDSHHVDP
jgi:uracil-DNA glycosylase family 4